MQKKGLTDKKRRFVSEYLVDQNATQAAIRAGYSKKTAYSQGQRLLKNVDVKAAVDDGLAKIEQENLVSVKYVLEGLKEVSERCLQRAPVMEFDRINRQMVQATDEDGNDVWQFDSTGANRSLELLGKHLKMFTDKHELQGKDGQPLTIEVNLQGSGVKWQK